MQKSGYKEWRGYPYALDLRGRPRKFGTPHYIYKNATTPIKAVSIANACSEENHSLAFPLLLKSNYSKSDFLGLFSQVRNNKLMHLWLGISPPSRYKDNDFLLITK